MGDIEDLAAFIVSLRPPDGAWAEALRLHAADILGAWIAAHATEEGQRLIAYRNDLAAATGVPNALDDIGVSCALARLSEVDDIHIGAMITAGAVAVPAAFGMLGAVKGCERRDLAPAILAGYEAMARMGRTINGPENHFRGIWTSYFAAPFGAAAVAARMLTLNETQTAHALALAVTMCAPSAGDQETPSTTRWWSFGQAVRNGISAALAVRSGFTADLNILRSKLLPGVFGITPDLVAMSGASDQPPALSDVSFKPWCAARQTMPATQALRELIADGVSPDDIASVQAYVVPLHLKMIGQPVEKVDRGSFMKSLSYQMAIAALAPQHRFDLRPAATMPTPEIRDFMARVTVIADQNLMMSYPKQWAARIVVETRDGARHERAIVAIPGDPGRPIEKAQLALKFEQVVSAAGVGGAKRLWEIALRLTDPDGGEALPFEPFSLRAEIGAGATKQVGL
jgi:2-methylcitrate dehydratase PrpD